MPMPSDLKKVWDRADRADRAESSRSSRIEQDRAESSRIEQTTGQLPGNSIEGLHGLIRQWVDEAPGAFTTADLDRELGIPQTARKAKNNRSDCLSDLVKQGILDRDPRRRGVFRRRNNQIVEMDLLGAKPEELPIALPFGLSNYVEVNKKEIFLIMGETNSGKTTVVFDMIWRNISVLLTEGLLREKDEPPTKDNFGLRYFSSEMGPTGVRQKLERFGPEYPIGRWVKYVASVERNRDFQDVVDPNGINWIDYLEVFDGEYFRLSSDITSIYSALDTGIAVICLQKKRGTDIGRGGEATLEKPRLAIALSENKERGFSTCKIIKAKHYRERNPVGLEQDFVIRKGGTKILTIAEWGYAEEHKRRRETHNYTNYMGANEWQN